jgi:flagellin
MARINSNIPAMIARSNLSRANQDLQVRLQRLSTGLRINRGADDPAGLIISERLRSEISGLNQAVNNSSRASSVIATTEGALSEVSDLLSSIKGLVVEAANTGATSDEERLANQLQIDSAIESITRISNSASFGGLKLLNGSLDYTLSGINSAQIAKTKVFSAFIPKGQKVQVDVQVLNSAQTADLFLSSPNALGTFVSTTTLAVAGPLGVQEIQILSNQPLSAVVRAVNNFTQATGISASLLNPASHLSGMRFSSVNYGNANFVSVTRLGGPAGGGAFRTTRLPDTFNRGTLLYSDPAFIAALAAASRDEGRNVAAVVNGNLATGRGTNISVQNSTSVSMDATLDTTFATTNGSSSTFYITGGGALYQLGGEINSSQQTNIGLQSIAASRLGGTINNGELQFLSSIKTGGGNDLNGRNFEAASKILVSAIDEISVLRGRLGAFERNTLQTNIRSLQTAIENLTASESQIRDADFAAETSALTRAQILTSAGTSVLALANQQSQQILQLLG